MVGVSLGATLLWVTPVKAIPLSNTTIDFATFFTWIGPSPFPIWITHFDFAGPGFSDGDALTAVYPGAGPAAGKWVYIFDVYHYPSSDVDVVNKVSWSWIEDPTIAGIIDPAVDPVNPITSFKIPQPPGWADEDITSVDWDPILQTVNVTFEIEKGEITYTFGLFSTLPPTLVEASLSSVPPTALVLKPLYYTPSPEPSACLLLGLGLMGTLIWKRRKA